MTTTQRYARICGLSRLGYPQKAIAAAVGLRSQSWVSAVLRRHGIEVRACDDPARLAKRAKWREWQRRHRDAEATARAEGDGERDGETD